MNRIVFGISGLGIYGIGLYVTYHGYKIYSLPPPIHNCHAPENQPNFSQQYSKLKDYDSMINWDEFLMRLSQRRRELAELAVGDVLETSAGTCRNLEYYNPEKVASLWLVDACESMLESGLMKMRLFKKSFGTKHISFTVMTSEDILYPADSFDTVIDTFGLCSHQDPVQALKEMSRVCKKNGHILLLQHGRSEYQWVDYILDRLAPDHAKNWGCWWNRDIEQLLLDSGLKPVQLKTYHFGTTYKIIARPNK
jgi:methyltransferase OMS1, mitochondrial